MKMCKEDKNVTSFIRMDAIEKKTKREELQKKAIVKLLGYPSMVAENCGGITRLDKFRKEYIEQEKDNYIIIFQIWSYP